MTNETPFLALQRRNASTEIFEKTVDAFLRFP